MENVTAFVKKKSAYADLKDRLNHKLLLRNIKYRPEISNFGLYFYVHLLHLFHFSQSNDMQNRKVHTDKCDSSAEYA